METVAQWKRQTGEMQYDSEGCRALGIAVPQLKQAVAGVMAAPPPSRPLEKIEFEGGRVAIAGGTVLPRRCCITMSAAVAETLTDYGQGDFLCFVDVLLNSIAFRAFSVHLPHTGWGEDYYMAACQELLNAVKDADLTSQEEMGDNVAPDDLDATHALRAAVLRGVLEETRLRAVNTFGDGPVGTWVPWAGGPAKQIDFILM
eukprot:6489573-Amphidinium_carterae.1